MSQSLHCLDGAPAPAAIAGDLRLVATLPEAARARFWDALGPALAEPVPDSIETTLDTFSRAYDVHPNLLGRALKASRFLVREASARGLSTSKFEEDVIVLCGGALSPESVVVAPLLLSRYESARKSLMGTAYLEAVKDHGDVLQSIEWRIDAVLASSRGHGGESRVAFITLGYGDGETKKNLSLQVTLEKIEELRRACERMLGT